MPPFFSIIVPVYNAEPYLHQCIDSILAQSFSDFDLFLVDDGSSDSSQAICDEYAAKDGRVQVIRQQNAGPTPARRNGLSHTQGSYICFVDADDWVVPHWLETLHGIIESNGQPDMVVFEHTRDTRPTEYPILAKEGFYDKARMEQEIYPYMLCDLRRRPLGTQLFPGMLWSKAVKRQLLVDHFITDDRITVFEDVAMIYDCATHAESMYITHEQLYIYRMVKNSNLHHYRTDYFLQLKMAQDYMLATLGGHSPALDRQISGFFTRRIVGGISLEYSRCGSLLPTTRAVACRLRQSGLTKAISSKGLPLFIRPYVWLLKLRLYLPVVLITIMKLDPAPKSKTNGTQAH